MIHVPRGVVVRELNETKALELKDLDKVPLGGREVKDVDGLKGKLLGVFGARFLWRVFFGFAWCESTLQNAAIFKCRQPNICLILRCVSCNLAQPWWGGGLGRESSLKMIKHFK